MKTQNYFFVALLLFSLLFSACTNEVDEQPTPAGLEEEENSSNTIDLYPVSETEESVDGRAGGTVTLNKIRVWLYRGSQATGTFMFKIRKVSNGELLGQTGQLSVSNLASVPNQLSINTGKFILNATNLKVTANEKYRVEIICSNTVTSSETNKMIFWGAKSVAEAVTDNMGKSVSTTSEGTVDSDYNRIAVFETEYVDGNGNLYLDDSQKSIGVLQSINVLATIPPDLTRLAIWQEFTPASSISADHFVSTWKTSNTSSGSSNTTSITIPTNATYGPYNYDIDWNNDGVFDQIGLTGSVTHDFGVAGTYTIRIRGDFPALYFDYSQDNHKLLDISQWGTQTWKALRFQQCKNFNITATDAPDLSQVTSMAEMFFEAKTFNAPLNHWNVSNVEDMTDLFTGATLFNQPLGNWDVSNVKNMSAMFSRTSFNQPLNNWDVSNVQDMGYMFNETPFNQALSNWDVSNVRVMIAMFATTPFNQPIGNWNVSKVYIMEHMFNGTPFNQPIGNWDVSNLSSARDMFGYAKWFNQPIGNWNLGNVDDIREMFQGASSFNQPLNNWDVSKVRHMEKMFYKATSFNQPIGDWNVSQVDDMDEMFNGAASFSTANYDNLLVGWSTRTFRNDIDFGASSTKYCSNAAAAAREKLIRDFHWTITDGGRDASCN